MAHWAIAVIGKDVDAQMQQVREQLEWDYYAPISESRYSFDRVAAVIKDGKVVKECFWDEAEQPLISTLPKSATVLDMHR